LSNSPDDPDLPWSEVATGKNPRGPRPLGVPPVELTELTGPLRWTIRRRIATGGMGAVYEGVQHGAEGFSKTVAIKTILEPYASNEEFKRMFIGEAKLVADLVHQNIAQVYQLGRFENLLYIVMEYVEGVTLREFNQRHRGSERRIPVELAAYIASRVCRGLEYAHHQRGADGELLGVVHRDVSPTNLMVTRLGEIKILDFGIAKARNLMYQQERERLMGKLADLSPEQAGLEPTDRRSDIFSLGVVLWEMLAGPQAHTVTLRWKPGEPRPALPRLGDVTTDVPPRLEAIVSKATATDPAARYENAGQMGYDLEYHMYHKGYGPTIVTMEKYLHEVFADRAWPESSTHWREQTLPGTIVLERPSKDEERR
jgi:serine/threonine-protein kinase